jgi:hypothetical protein
MKISQMTLVGLGVIVAMVSFFFVFNNPNKDGLTVLLVLFGIVIVFDGHYTAKAFELRHRQRKNIEATLEAYKKRIEQSPHLLEDNKLGRWIIKKIGVTHALYTIRPLEFFFFIVLPVAIVIIWFNYSRLVMGMLFSFMVFYSGYILKQIWGVMEATADADEYI